MAPEQHELTHGLRMAGVAVVSAVIVAAVVIGAGEALMARAETGAQADAPLVIRTGG